MLVKVVAVFLGIAVGVAALVALACSVQPTMPDDEAAAVARRTGHSAYARQRVSLPRQSFAGTVPDERRGAGDGARRLRMRRCRRCPWATVAKVHMTLKDMTVEIAPGVKYNTWAFDGHGGPARSIHVRQGQTVEMTLTNGGPDPALDRLPRRAHRAQRRLQGRRAGQLDHVQVQARRSRRITCTTAARSPCSPTSRTACTGRSSSSPRAGLPPVDNEYVLVGSEWYMHGDGTRRAGLARHGEGARRMADWVTFNGYANQYVTHPLTADPGETTRFWVVAAGPTLTT